MILALEKLRQERAIYYTVRPCLKTPELRNRQGVLGRNGVLTSEGSS